MYTVTLDKTGKIYLPKTIRQKMRGKHYRVIAMPDGEITFHEIKKYKTAREALEDIAKNPLKGKIPAAKAREAALKAALEEISEDLE